MGYFKEAAKGVSWMGALRLVIRSLALVKIAILARILLPSQFGIYGIALLALGFLETLTETGINVFLIQEGDHDEDYINSAWVVSIIRGLLIFVLILILAPGIASFFNTPKALPLLCLVAWVAFIRGFINPSEVDMQKKLQFDKLFMFQSFLFLVDAAVAISVALFTRSESALIWAMIASASLEVVLSFLIFRRPRFAFEIEKIKKVINRGKWLTGAGVLNYAFRNLDNIAVGKLLGPNPLGLYQQAYQIATLPVAEVGETFNRVTFPVYVSISGEAQRLRKAFYQTTVVIASLVVPFGVLGFLFANEIVLLFLGRTWLSAVPILKVLAVFGIFKAVITSTYPLFLAIKKQKWITVIEVFAVLGLALPLVPFIKRYGILGAGYAVIIGGLVSIPVVIFFLVKAFRYAKAT